MKVIAGMLVLWAAGLGLGAAGMLGWAALGLRAPRLVAWGARQRDVQVGSWDDRMRVADQLIFAAARRLDAIGALVLLQEESNRRQQARAIARMNLMQDGL